MRKEFSQDLKAAIGAEFQTKTLTLDNKAVKAQIWDTAGQKKISGMGPCPESIGKVPKILFDVANQNSGEAEFLTPQQKLLNSIDRVEKMVMEELHKLKRTPAAKKAERERRMRILMSMR